MMMMMILTMAD